MIFLNSTITFSIGLTPFLYFMLIGGFLVVYLTFNVMIYKRLCRIPDYSRYKITDMDTRIQYLIIFSGLLIVPFFNKAIKDGLQFTEIQNKIMDLNRDLMMTGMADTDHIYKEMKMKQRALKILKLKYKKKSFVKRKVFSIFVGK